MKKTYGRPADRLRIPAGNLVLHIIGGLHHFFGATLGHTGYIRERSQEFIIKGVDRKELVQQLEKVIPVVTGILEKLTPQDMESAYPIFFDKEGTSTGYVLTQLALHLNYHLGQVNYLRRILEP